MRVLKALMRSAARTEWQAFRNPNFERMKNMMRQPVIFDGRNIFDPAIAPGRVYLLWDRKKIRCALSSQAERVFWAVICADRLLTLGYEVVAVDNLLTGSTRKHLPICLGHPVFTILQTQRHRILCLLMVLSMRCMHFRIAGVARGLSGNADPDAESGLARHAQGTRTRQGRRRRDSCLRARRRSTGIHLVNPQPETYWGNVNPLGRAAYTTKRSGSPKR